MKAVRNVFCCGMYDVGEWYGESSAVIQNSIDAVITEYLEDRPEDSVTPWGSGFLFCATAVSESQFAAQLVAAGFSASNDWINANTGNHLTLFTKFEAVEN